MNDKTESSPVQLAEGIVVAISQSLYNNSTSYHLALKIFDKCGDTAFEIHTFSGICLTELPLVNVGDKVKIQYYSRPITTFKDGTTYPVTIANELLDIRIDWLSAYRNTFKYGDFS